MTEKRGVLRKEPQERYATRFSEDLQNYLEARPILARKGDTWYQTQRFIRRHWLSTAATAVVTASLLTGLFVANRQRAIAERRFSQIRKLSQRVIDLDGAIRILPGSVDARQRLVSASLEYLEGLSQDARGNFGFSRGNCRRLLGGWRASRA